MGRLRTSTLRRGGGQTSVPETGREEIEQLRMTGPFSLRTKVIGRFHQPIAEEHRPVSIDRDPGREWVLLGNQPAGQRQSIGRTGRQRRQERWGSGLHALSPRAEVAPNEHVGLPRRIQLLHDESGRNLGIEGVLVPAGLSQGFLGAQIIHRMVLAVEAAQLIALFIRTLAARLGHDRRITLEGQGLCLGCRQRPGINPQVIQLSGEVGLSIAGTDAQGLGSGEGTLELILLGLQILAHAVDEELHSGGLGRSIVTHGDMKPLVLRQLLLGADLDDVIRPSLDEVGLEAAIRNQQVHPTVSRTFLHLAEEGPIALDADPSGHREGVGSSPFGA